MPQQRSSRRGSGYHRGSSNRYPYQGPQWGQVFQSSQDNLLSQLTSPEATLAIASNLISTLLQSQQTQVHSYTDRGQPGDGRGGAKSGVGDPRGVGQEGPTGSARQGPKGAVTPLARGRGGINKQPMRVKAAGKKDEAVDKKSKAPDKTKDDAEKKKIISKYAGVPDMLFFCHICNKHLWDAQCFDKHLTGRPHTETFDRQREGYKLKTLLLRKKLKINTEKMELELDTPQPKKPRIQQFCAMCDTHYYGGVVLHRRTWDHQERCVTYLAFESLLGLNVVPTLLIQSGNRRMYGGGSP
uniref:CIZ1 C2H2-type zinc finger domain-containing protein n=2 Tax=Timema TaxID=61471 RepID=A0A7R9G2B2_TIMSH|nr:unnamed protein product [Timema shepardi]